MVIAGAGPAGCAAGIELARRGLRVTVFDRARFPRPKTCGDAVSSEAAALVDHLGEGRELLRQIPHAVVRGAAAVFPDTTRLTRDFGERPGYIVPRLSLDDLLRRLLVASGAALIEDRRVNRVLVDERGRAAGLVAGRGAEKQTWRASAVIAADGPGSVGWAALGQPYHRGRRLGLAITAYARGVDFGAQRGVNEHYFLDGLPCGYGWIFPEVDGVANVGIYQRSDRYRSSEQTLRNRLASFVRSQRTRFATAELEGAPRSWPLPLASHPGHPMGMPGLLLCGDAGYLVDPLSGEGIWQALRSGQLAAEVTARALAGSGLGRRAVAHYALRCLREIRLPSLGRYAIQTAMIPIVERQLYRHGIVRELIARGYRHGGALEMSK